MGSLWLWQDLYTLSCKQNCRQFGKGDCSSFSSLPQSYLLTGCDTTSAFLGKGKKSAWQAWKAFPDVTEALKYMVDHPFAPISATSPHFVVLERFTVVLYNKNSANQFVNEERRELFCKNNKSMDHIPPTQVNQTRKYLLKILRFVYTMLFLIIVHGYTTTT